MKIFDPCRYNLMNLCPGFPFQVRNIITSKIPLNPDTLTGSLSNIPTKNNNSSRHVDIIPKNFNFMGKVGTELPNSTKIIEFYKHRSALLKNYNS